MTLDELKYGVYSRLLADQSAPAPSNVHDDNFVRWFDEISPEVINRVATLDDIQALVVYDNELTLASGSVNLPTNFLKAISVKGGTVKRKAELEVDPDKFSDHDGHNFLTTPDAAYPVALVANGKLYVKPTSLTKAYLDYVKVHPTLSGSQGTVWSKVADSIAIKLLADKLLQFKVGSGDGGALTQANRELQKAGNVNG